MKYSLFLFFWLCFLPAFLQITTYGMHRYNPSLRGMVKVNCIANPAIEWIFESRDQFKAAPAVAGDYCVVGNTTGIMFSHLANMLNFITVSL